MYTRGVQDAHLFSRAPSVGASSSSRDSYAAQADKENAFQDTLNLSPAKRRVLERDRAYAENFSRASPEKSNGRVQDGVSTSYYAPRNGQMSLQELYPAIKRPVFGDPKPNLLSQYSENIKTRTQPTRAIEDYNLATAARARLRSEARQEMSNRLQAEKPLAPIRSKPLQPIVDVDATPKAKRRMDSHHIALENSEDGSYLPKRRFTRSRDSEVMPSGSRLLNGQEGLMKANESTRSVHDISAQRQASQSAEITRRNYKQNSTSADESFASEADTTMDPDASYTLGISQAGEEALQKLQSALEGAGVAANPLATSQRIYIPKLAPISNQRRKSTVLTKVDDVKTKPITKTSSILQGVVAFVDVRLSDGTLASTSFEQQLESLGAKVRARVSGAVTHVIYKNGSSTTLTK